MIGCSLASSRCAGLLSLVLLTMGVSPLSAQPADEDIYTVRLRSRTFTPAPGLALSADAVNRVTEGQAQHVLVQLIRSPGEGEAARFEKAGIRLLDYVGSFTWYAAIVDRRALEFQTPAARRERPLLAAVRWMGEIEPRDKVDVKIQEHGFGSYARNPDGTVGVIVQLYRDVDTARARDVLREYAARLQGPGVLNDWRLNVDESALWRVAAEDAVQYIEEVPPPDGDHNDCSRGSATVDPVQVAPYNLDGTNVQVGEWDGGEIGAHNDLAGRVTVVEAVGVGDHATHVAGTLAGDGAESAGSGGGAQQWRGVATAVHLYSYSYTGGNLEPEEHNGAINDADKLIDLSQNSWGLDLGNNDPLHGDYRTRTAKYDNVVRGVYDRKIPIVFSAGNNQQRIAGGFGTITPPGGTAKNVITVGAINCNDASMTTFSSWGPTDNDLLKPDVVAPGGEGGAGGVVSTIAQNHDEDNVNNNTGTGPPDGIDDFFFSYSNDNAGAGEPEPVGTAAAPEDLWEGTSMAAPVVSGVVALMLQEYRETYFDSATVDDAPLPSTFKAILCHTADDLTANPTGGANLNGPDYIYGYGLVDGRAAVDVIREKRFREGVLVDAADEDLYTMQVPAGTAELRVTLAWDDDPGTAGAANILDNDLDLMLIAPGGAPFHPPWELDPANPGNATVRASYATEAVAATHRDEVNVVEQVLVDNPASGAWTIRISAADLPHPRQRYSLVAGETVTEQLEGRVDIVQVLDRSGSMGGAAAAGSTDKKIEVLRFAADQFIQMMRPDVGNQLGVVQFNQDVVPFTGAVDPSLKPLTAVPDRVTELRNAVASIVHGGSTSIGDGLAEARQYFLASGAPDNDPVVLLVTDGKENTPLMISNVQAQLVGDGIVVYPLGLGYGSGVDEAKLTTLAEETGGTYRITADPLVFRKFFLEILAGAVDWSVLVDPIGELGPEDTADVRVTLLADQDQAVLTVYWADINDAIDLELITPSGTPITQATADGSVLYYEHPRYAMFALKFPLNGALASEWDGVWTMRLSGTNKIPSDDKVAYSSSAFATGEVRLSLMLDTPSHLTGDRVKLAAKLTRRDDPVIGARVRAVCDVPTVGAGNLLQSKANKRLRLASLPASGVASEPVNAVDRRFDALVAEAGGIEALRGSIDLDLLDDGQHGDGSNEDGLYANHLTQTRIQGSYTCRVIASSIPTASGRTVTREWSTSFYNEVDIEPGSSTVSATPLGRTDDGWQYRVDVVPRDRFGNYLGPGRPVVVKLSGLGTSKTLTLTDNLDGTYTGFITVPEAVVDAGGRLDVEVSGTWFTSIQPPRFGRWALSFHAGVAAPQGSFANISAPDVSYSFDLDWRITSRLSVVGLLGYYSFKPMTPAAGDPFWVALSGNLRYRLTDGDLSGYVRGGPGVYFPDVGGSEFGANAGVGVTYRFRRTVSIEAGLDYHEVFDPDVAFLDTHVGLLVRF